MLKSRQLMNITLIAKTATNSLDGVQDMAAIHKTETAVQHNQNRQTDRKKKNVTLSSQWNT